MSKLLKLYTFNRVNLNVNKAVKIFFGNKKWACCPVHMRLPSPGWSSWSGTKVWHTRDSENRCMDASSKAG